MPLASIAAKFLIRKVLARFTGCRYSGIYRSAMRFWIVIAALILTLPTSLRADARSEAEEAVKFGIDLAQHNLWREAIARFVKAADIDPTYAPAWNNLAIAYEQQGDLDNARKAYDRALKLAPDNQYVRQNYELFREINDRANRQSGR
jgi:Flp pilus assembly protein TadD